MTKEDLESVETKLESKLKKSEEEKEDFLKKSADLENKILELVQSAKEQQSGLEEFCKDVELKFQEKIKALTEEMKSAQNETFQQVNISINILF